MLQGCIAIAKHLQAPVTISHKWTMHFVTDTISSTKVHSNTPEDLMILMPMLSTVKGQGSPVVESTAQTGCEAHLLLLFRAISFKPM
jgi:hypothetical protein